MRILMVTMGLDIGGAETHIVELSKQLHDQGYDIAVVSNGGVYVPEITAAGIRHYNAPLHRRTIPDMHRSRLILRDVIRKEKPDIVHAHARIPAFLCGSLQKSFHFPFVTTAHWVFDASGALRYLTDWGQRTIAVSEDIRNYLIQEYHVPAEHISVTINGIDVKKFSPDISGERIHRELALDPSAPIVSYVSRMDEDRALVARQLIEIAPQLSRAAPGVQLLLAGGGNVYEELHRRAEEVNRRLGRRCIVMPGPRTDINEIVAAGDIFVGVSRAALEAMSAARPVIVAGNEGYHGLFGPEKLNAAMEGNFCCRGMPLSTPKALLSDVVTALALPEKEKARLGSYGRQVIQDHYSVRCMAADAIAVYEQVRKRKYNVMMSGYYGFRNAGDDAILESIAEGIRSASDEISLTALSRDPAQTEKQFGIQAIPRFQLPKVISALRNCDALLSGGGSLMQDTTSTRSILYYLSIIHLAQLMGKPVMLYANGIGPVQRPSNQKKVRRAVQRAAVVTLRDHSSAQDLVRMGVTRTDLHVTADPVFHLSPAPKERALELIRTTGLQPDRPFAAVSVRDWPDTGSFLQELAILCDHLYEKHGMRILFLLMQPSRDLDTTKLVQKNMKHPSFCLDEPCSPTELMAVLGQARLCLAMRLHTLIFAARMAVPTIGLVYDPKVESYLQELQLPSAGNVNSFQAREAIARTDALLANYDAVLAGLREKSAQLTQSTLENEHLLLQMLEDIRK